MNALVRLVSITRLPVVQLQIDERLAELNACVIHDDVDLRALLVPLRERLGDSGLVGDVECTAQRLIAFARKFADRFSNRVRTRAVEHDAGAGRRQPLGQRIANAACRAGNERRASGEIE